MTVLELARMIAEGRTDSRGLKQHAISTLQQFHGINDMIFDEESLTIRRGVQLLLKVDIIENVFSITFLRHGKEFIRTTHIKDIFDREIAEGLSFYV